MLARGSATERRAAFATALEIIRRKGDDRAGELLEYATVLATIRLDAPTINHIVEEAGMTVESIAEFYRDTIIGRTLRDVGRQEGRQEGREEGRHEERAALLAAMLRARFGDDPRIPEISARLAEGDQGDAAVAAIAEAASVDDLG